MPTVSPILDAPSSPTAKEEPPPSPDGWPVGLQALRAELDRIDDALHDLLMQRALVVERVARSGKRSAFRPGREATMIRRLLARHGGSLPPQAVFRIWRELLAGTTAMQGGFSLAVCDSDAGAGITQLAREHFGALTPLRVHGSAGQALTEISNGTASVAVLPFPSDTETWWTALLHQEPRIHVVARLPFWTGRPEGAPAVEALAVAASTPDPSGLDRSFLGLECDDDVSRTRLASELTAAGLAPETLVLLRDPGGMVARVLVEVDGFLSDEDPRLGALGAVLRRPVVLGGYAVPIGHTT
ncbi:MAG TPA: chorismate mutase [Acetobacteraceae bacterium]|jgi:chorismate mutase